MNKNMRPSTTAIPPLSEFVGMYRAGTSKKGRGKFTESGVPMKGLRAVYERLLEEQGNVMQGQTMSPTEEIVETANLDPSIDIEVVKSMVQSIQQDLDELGVAVGLSVEENAIEADPVYGLDNAGVQPAQEPVTQQPMLERGRKRTPSERVFLRESILKKVYENRRKGNGRLSEKDNNGKKGFIKIIENGKYLGGKSSSKEGYRKIIENGKYVGHLNRVEPVKTSVTKNEKIKEAVKRVFDRKLQEAGLRKTAMPNVSTKEMVKGIGVRPGSRYHEAIPTKAYNNGVKREALVKDTDIKNIDNTAGVSNEKRKEKLREAARKIMEKRRNVNLESNANASEKFLEGVLIKEQEKERMKKLFEKDLDIKTVLREGLL